MGDEVVDDRRAVIEAALNAAEAGEQSDQAGTGSEAPKQGALPGETGGEPAGQESDSAVTPSAEESSGEAPKEGAVAPGTESPAGTDEKDTQGAVEPAPASWKATPKAKWASLDPEVRAEVLRREREVTNGLEEVSSVRQFAKQFSQVVQPFSQRLQALGAHPLTAVQNLLQADYVLANAPQHQKAQHLVKLIKDYGIDVRALDDALAGVVDPKHAEEDRIAQLVEARLAPINQFLTAQQQREAQAQAEQDAALESSVSTFQNNPKYPHFEAVRETMADLVEISGRRGVSLSLEEAYNRAVGADPQLATALEAQRQAAAVKAAAQRAQQAKAASVSVSGSPGGSSVKPASGDRRATIAAALDALGGM